MPKTRQLLRREVTYSDVKDEEFNILHQLEYYDAQTQFFRRLYDKRDSMKVAVAHHLGLNSSSECYVSDTKDWLHGSFNVLVPVKINCWAGKQVLMRFPLPYRIGESFRPGNCDEKVRCEAGAYAWLQENCPDVPIPQLYGFSLSSGETVQATTSCASLSSLLTDNSLLGSNTCHFSLGVTSSYAGTSFHGWGD